MAYEKDGKIILKGYKQHLKTLVKGNRWNANNPQMVQLGLGKVNMARKLIKGTIIVDIAFAAVVNAIDTVFDEEKNGVDFVGRTGIDITKGLIAMGIGAGAGVLAMLAMSGMVLVGGVVFAAISFGVSIGLDAMDNHYEITDTLVQKWKEAAENANEN